jgi:hypothetical protein
MREVRVARAVPGTVHQAETCWYDTGGWPSWVEELRRVLAVRGPWPQAGASVVWQSGPAGRGRVTERVLEHEPLSRQVLEVEDDSIRGRQTVAFAPHERGAEVALSLAYEIKRRSPLTRLVDWLFIRRAMETSLARTLERFERELSERIARGG